jgi:hypothetical protein
LVAFDVKPLTAHSMMTGSSGILSRRSNLQNRTEQANFDPRTSSGFRWLGCRCDESSGLRRLPFRRDVSLRVPDVAVDSRGMGREWPRSELALLQPRADQPSRGHPTSSYRA